MKRLAPLRRFRPCQALRAYRDMLLLKDDEGLRLLDSKRKELAFYPTATFVKEILVSSSGLVLLVPGLFEKRLEAYQVKADRNIERKADIPVDGLVQDAVFAKDDALYVLARDEGGAKVFRFKDGTSEEIVLPVERSYFQIGFAPNRNAVYLLSEGGHVAFIAGNAVQGVVKVGHCHKVYALRQGNSLLCDAPFGFRLVSGTGKVLRHLDFLLPSEEEERVFDFAFEEESGTLVCLTSSRTGKNIYVFDTASFALVQSKMAIEKEARSLAVDKGMVDLLYDGFVDVLEIRPKD